MNLQRRTKNIAGIVVLVLLVVIVLILHLRPYSTIEHHKHEVDSSFNKAFSLNSPINVQLHSLGVKLESPNGPSCPSEPNIKVPECTESRSVSQYTFQPITPQLVTKWRSNGVNLQNYLARNNWVSPPYPNHSADIPLNTLLNSSIVSHTVGTASSEVPLTDAWQLKIGNATCKLLIGKFGTTSLDVVEECSL